MAFDDKIADASKSILNYCLSRTSNSHDAEDLAQDIICELIKSVGNLRDEQAFYGFMWGIAGNVYKQWYRKKINRPDTDEFDSNMDIEDIVEDDSDLYLLRRELSLLSEKYRKATILYYTRSKSCGEIAAALNISESMVKYLLFKSRQILKEGITMNRNYGEQSYNPRKLVIYYHGQGPNKFTKLIDESLIRQNISWACYNDSLADNEIALQIGVALPYIEKDLDLLLESGLLIKNGTKYTTNTILFSDEYMNELSNKISDKQREYADAVNKFVTDIKPDVMALEIDYEMSENTYKWQIATKLFSEIYSEIMNSYDLYKNMPTTGYGEKAYVFGLERYTVSMGTCTLENEYGYVTFNDWHQYMKSDHRHFYGKWKKRDLLLDIAINNKSEFNEYEEEMVAEMVKEGYIVNGKSIFPVYTQSQYDKLINIFAPFIEEIKPLVNEIVEIAYGVLKNHAPSHLKNQIREAAYMTSHTYIYPQIIDVMINNNQLSINWDANQMPATYIVKR
jgi:RNA polymerase sigma factor, sigma-70 family